jgi:hypothetical protein
MSTSRRNVPLDLLPALHQSRTLGRFGLAIAECG